MKTRSEIQLAIHAAIADVVAGDMTITPDTHLHDTLGMDSLDITALTLTLEPIFGIVIPTEDEGKIGNMTIRQLTDYLEGRL